MIDSDATLPPPSVPHVEGYDDLELIDSGGSAEVFRATDTNFERPVAIKVLRVRLSDDSARDEFRRECLAIGRVGDHPNIVRVYSAGATTDGRPYLAMALMEGSYGARLPEGGLAVDEVLRVGTALCGAVATAHAAGVLHRDIKPENLLESRHGTCVLADFGVSTVAARTTTQSPLGLTLQHAAPEVLEGEPASVRSDVYSLASTLFHLVSGRAPFAGDGDPFAPMQKLTRCELPRLPDAAERLGLGEVLRDAMQRDPGDRTASAEELGRCLERCAHRAGVDLAPMLVLRPPGASDDAHAHRGDPDAHASSTRSTRSPGRVALTALAALSAVMLVGAGVWWSSANDAVDGETEVLGRTAQPEPDDWGSTPDELIRSLDDVIVSNVGDALELPRSCITTELTARSEERLRSMLDAGAGDHRNVDDLGAVLRNCGLSREQLADTFVGGPLDPGTVPAASVHRDCVRDRLDHDEAAEQLAIIALTDPAYDTVRTRVITDSVARVAMSCATPTELVTTLSGGLADLDLATSPYMSPSDLTLILECIEQGAAAGTIGAIEHDGSFPGSDHLWAFLVNDSDFPAPLREAYEEARERAASSLIAPTSAVVVSSDGSVSTEMACSGGPGDPCASAGVIAATDPTVAVVC